MSSSCPLAHYHFVKYFKNGAYLILRGCSSFSEAAHRPIIGGRGNYSVVGITCPLVGIGLTDLPKTGGRGAIDIR